ncbi:hypothetical protein EW146_g9173 [Bondarzewia mesenterica]|uniref:Cytochrome P450 n=1 Tax=Bondarzewia mesenterica TaxID=1095465 RepID=A0A4S4L8F4_9AGAM|nr:hypothetical protein EW146_g9173 [Bondarzewia mesenterica]
MPLKQLAIVSPASGMITILHPTSGASIIFMRGYNLLTSSATGFASLQIREFYGASPGLRFHTLSGIHSVSPELQSSFRQTVQSAPAVGHCLRRHVVPGLTDANDRTVGSDNAISRTVWTNVAVDVAGIVVALFLTKAYLRRRTRNGLPLPPGPKPLPVIGNLLDVPRKQPAWLVYEQWGKKYGDIMSITVLGQTIVILNSPTIAKELLDKRGAKYSDRPEIPMIKLMHLDVANIALQRYSKEWRMTRRIADHSLRPSASITYRPMQRKNAHRFLRLLLKDPEEFVQHIRHFTTAIAMSVAYGYEIADYNDRYVVIAEEAVSMGAASFYPGAWLVNVIPSLNHLPGWLPGMGFKKYARDCAKLVNEMIEAPFAYVKERMRDGTALPSLSQENLDTCQSEEEERMIKYVASSIYSAGADTSGSTLSTMFLALARFPEAQKRAQAEIDAIVGRGRLPDYDDREKMPYIEALCQELLRWRLASPMGTVRTSMEDDVYDGYFIPKGSYILANAWAMLHDPTTYPDPDAFKPERFLNADGKFVEDPILASHFGFGRRICPGRHLALATLWITVTSVLAVFNVTKAKDENGKEVDVGADYSDSLVSFPLPFKCAIVPRDARSMELIGASETSVVEGQVA